MKNLSRSAIAILLVGLIGCGHESKYLTRDLELRDAWTASSDARYIRVVGVGSAPDNVKDRTRRRGLSRASGLIGARVELIALVKGVTLAGSTDISRLVHQRDQVRQLVNATVAGAEEERVEFDASDSAIVVLRIERRLVRKMLMETGRADAANPEDAIAALEKKVALMDSRTKALVSTFPGMKAE